MKPITLFFVVLLAVAGFGAGVLVGRHGGKTNAKATDAAVTPAIAPEAGKLPAVKAKPHPSATTYKSGPWMSLAEIETALAELKSSSRSKLWERVNEIARAVDPADIPQVMALVAKLSLELQNSLRYALLPRWAEADPRAAMDYASGLKNVNERHQTILNVLSGWAKMDPQGATAWVEQLPAGRLRNEAPPPLRAP